MTKYMVMKISGIFGGKIQEGYWKQIVALSPRLLRGDGRGGGIGECKERPGVSKRGWFLFEARFQNIDDQHPSVLFYMRGVTIKLLLEFTCMGEKR